MVVRQVIVALCLAASVTAGQRACDAADRPGAAAEVEVRKVMTDLLRGGRPGSARQWKMIRVMGCRVLKARGTSVLPTLFAVVKSTDHSATERFIALTLLVELDGEGKYGTELFVLLKQRAFATTPIRDEGTLRPLADLQHYLIRHIHDPEGVERLCKAIGSDETQL